MNATLRTILHTVAAAFGGLAIIFAVGAWRLSSGPLSLGFLSPYLEEAFQAEDLPYRIEFDDTVLTWAGWERTLDILVVNARAVTPEGETILSVPQVSLGLSGLSLVRGAIAPTSIELIEPRIELIRQVDGTLDFAVGGSRDTGTSGAFADLVADLLAPPHEDHLFGRLSRVSVIDADMSIEDLRLGVSWRAPRANLVFELDPASIAGQLTLDAELDDETARIEAITFYDRASQQTHAAMRFTELIPARFAHLSPDLSPFAGMRLPVSGTLTFGMTRGGTIDGIDFELTGGAGILDLPKVFPAEVEVRSLVAQGSVDGDYSVLDLRKLELVTDGPRFALTGTIRDTAAGVGVRGHFSAQNMPFDALGRYWPEGLIRAGRDWILLNVTDGMMTRFDADLDVRPGELEAQSYRRESGTGDFVFEDVTINYLHPMPAVRGVDGVGRFTGQTLDLDMRNGVLRGLRTTSGTARMTGLMEERPEMLTIVEAEGSAQEALELLDHPRLGLASKVGLDPAQIHGRVRTQFALSFPMIKAAAIEEIDISAVARLTDMAVDKLFGTFDMTGGDLRATVDRSSLDLRGTIAIEGMPAEVAWQELFAEDAQFRSRYEVEMPLTPEGQAALGFDFSPYADGTLDLRLVYTDPGADQARTAIFLGAQHASLAMPELFWTKPAGEDGWVQLLLELPKNGPIEVSSIEVQSATFHALGRASIEPGFAGLREIEITRVQHDATDISARIVPDDQGGLSVSVTGASLDLRPYLQRLRTEGTSDLPPFTLDIEVDRVITRADQQLTQCRARLNHTADGLRSGFLEGTLPTGEPLRILIEPMGKKRRLVARSADAGAVARAFDIYDNAIGGKLALEAVLHDDLPGGPVTGLVEIDDYQVINAPSLAQLLSIASLTGILDALLGEGIGFSSLNMPFELTDDILRIDGARTSGASLGLTADGTVNLESSDTSIHGTIVPAYSINGILGQIPLLGDLLVGGEGEGLFAATYRVSGPIEEPTMSVNPLAVLAPGFLRNLFSIFDTEEGGTPPPVNPRKQDSN